MNALSTQPLQRLHNVPAPAKLNLFLHITGRRNDGYHLLQSVFMLIDWCDTLDFALRRDGAIHREDAQPGHLPTVDLCVQAARALQSATGCALGADIRLHKSIPAEAGMGGGSSDAATCLMALNRLWGLGLSRSALARIGEQLGADVPFFVGGRNAWVEGVGERLTPVELPSARFVVLKPPSGASTRAIFASDKLQRDTKHAIIQGFAANRAHDFDAQAEAFTAGQPVVEALPLDLDKILALGKNDLQPAAQALCPDIERGLRWLASLGFAGRMTGSGSAVFAPATAEDCAALSDADLPQGWVLKVCSNMDAHPLFDWCSD